MPDVGTSDVFVVSRKFAPRIYQLVAGVVLGAAVVMTSACGAQPAAPGESKTEESVVPSGSVADPSRTQQPTESAEEEKPNFPLHPIKIIVTHSPGGATDTPPRLLAPYAEKILGQPVVLENMPGAGGNIAREFVWKANPDGYTLLASQSPSMDSGQIVTNADFDPLGFEHVFNIAGKNYNATGVRSDSPYPTLADLIEAAKAKPGSINIAGPGLGTNSHVSVKLLERAAGIQLNYVPFDSGAEVIAALLGGQVDAASANLGDFVNKPELLVLATDGPERDLRAPEIATFKEQGIDAALDQLGGLFAPPGTPKRIVQILADAFREAGQNEEFQEKLKNSENQPFFLKTDEFLEAHTEIYQAIQSIADVLK